MTQARLMEIYKHVPPFTEVVLVNDASPDKDCRSGAGFWQKKVDLFPIKYVENPKNLGFGGSHNRGAKVASGDILIFLSNDVVISGPFVDKIKDAMIDYKENVVVGGRVLYHDTGWNTIMLNGKSAIIPYPEGWLIACTRAMWDRIGGFDPIYAPYDAEDLDIGAWCIYNDVPMVGLNLSTLHHLSGQTIYSVNPQRQEITKRNIERYKEKWMKKLEEKYEKK
jgi:GT2 family glycosyltransferase